MTQIAHSPTALSRIYKPIDSLLKVIAYIGCVAIVLLVSITMYDVSTRYLGVPKFAGLNSTMVQESEYWAHAFLFALVIGYGYTRQSHVRIDLVRDMLPRRGKLIMEIFGILVLLMPYALIGTWYCFKYALKSYIDGEVSPSTNGLTNFWILKSTLPTMFFLILLAGISQLLKCIDALMHTLDPDTERSLTGGGH